MMQGRKVHIPEATLDAGTGRFSFSDLCEKPLGGADYLGVSGALSVVFVSDLPLFTEESIDKVLRFIKFVVSVMGIEAYLLVHIDQDKEGQSRKNLFLFSYQRQHCKCVKGKRSRGSAFRRAAMGCCRRELK
ncbi:hypothetical protein PsorP6_008559 [Peronosclerospora sorghi]|uniref:Uncharacterized protein n=1 Tax=Peronosclerospora sorghi TaxID=230839 RepID=A0ACC0W7S4_9STRA|nr:hypothetical protein PsorP6_008559 [Peronosclerospora sorghi]